MPRPWVAGLGFLGTPSPLAECEVFYGTCLCLQRQALSIGGGSELSPARDAPKVHCKILPLPLLARLGWNLRGLLLFPPPLANGGDDKELALS